MKNFLYKTRITIYTLKRTGGTVDTGGFRIAPGRLQGRKIIFILKNVSPYYTFIGILKKDLFPGIDVIILAFTKNY